MEALIGLFLIVVVFALLSGAGSRTEGERPAARSDRPTPAQAATTRQESVGGSFLSALMLLLTIVALMYNVR